MFRIKEEDDSDLSVRDKKIKQFFKSYIKAFEKFVCIFILFFVIPGYYFYLVVFVQPALMAVSLSSEVLKKFNLLLSMFGVVNIAGNMLMGSIANLSVTTLNCEETGKVYEYYCKKCMTYCPPKSWHCYHCEVCILDRDHHCLLFSRCIGLKNQRYFILYLIYVMIGLSYFNYNLYHYLSSQDGDIPFTVYGTTKAIFNLIYLTGIASYFANESLTDVGMVIFVVNFALIFWSASLLYFHGTNLLRGISTHESLKGYKNTRTVVKDVLKSWRSWGNNIVQVFGTRWYLAFFWPFVSSPLPKYTKFDYTID